MRAARFHPGEGLRIEDVDRSEPGPGDRSGRPSPVGFDGLHDTLERLEAGELQRRGVLTPNR